MKKVSFLLSSLLLASSLFAQSGNVVDMTVFTDRGFSQEWYGRGSLWVAGEKGEGYTIRISNKTTWRVMAVVSVDGVNVITGETASPSQSGYVIEPYGYVDVNGWRKNYNSIAKFRFTNPGNSYASRTDRPNHLGVIGAAVFLEKQDYNTMVRVAEEKRKMNGVDSSSPVPASLSAAKQELGTAHGEKQYDPASTTTFVRSNKKPAEVLSIRYDSIDGLVKRGVIPSKKSAVCPNPFPGFTPDPN